MPLLHGPAGAAGVQRPGDAGADAGGAVAPHIERAGGAGTGDVRIQAEGLVAVPGGAQLAGGGVLPDGEHAIRVSGVRGAHAGRGAAAQACGGPPQGEETSPESPLNR